MGDRLRIPEGYRFRPTNTEVLKILVEKIKNPSKNPDLPIGEFRGRPVLDLLGINAMVKASFYACKAEGAYFFLGTAVDLKFSQGEVTGTRDPITINDETATPIGQRSDVFITNIADENWALSFYSLYHHPVADDYPAAPAPIRILRLASPDLIDVPEYSGHLPFLSNPDPRRRPPRRVKGEPMIA